jgi:hypothetical protein
VAVCQHRMTGLLQYVQRHWTDIFPPDPSTVDGAAVRPQIWGHNPLFSFSASLECRHMHGCVCNSLTGGNPSQGFCPHAYMKYQSLALSLVYVSNLLLSVQS